MKKYLLQLISRKKAEMKNLQPFIENDEIVEIQLWDASTPLDHFDPLDRKILDYIK